eukprot:m.24263 g.24263  ORF g.24263 m.24263 type:complete len:108 (-) comp4147_c0_seq2:73-396(-)
MHSWIHERGIDTQTCATVLFLLPCMVRTLFVWQGADGGPGGSDEMFDAMLVSQAPEEDQAFFDNLVERMANSKIVDAAPADSAEKADIQLNDEMSFFDMMAATKKGK